MDIADLIAPDRIALDLRVRHKGQLLRELARRVAPFADGIPVEMIEAALQSRETLGSTGLGRGFALPHARLEGLSRLVGLFARLARPIEYDSIDGKAVDLVFLLLMPAGADNNSVAALAAVSRRFRDEDCVARLRKVDGVGVQRVLTGV
jgi:PTS system nitrogen regulatory IIA component